VPKSVRHVCIYADNDAGSDFTGQAEAYALARRLLREVPKGQRMVEVFVPERPGVDWDDIRLQCETSLGGSSKLAA